ncbi:MAG: hypothetical protein ACFFKA_20340 [Candidatus Thorarchaeota archaeon]
MGSLKKGTTKFKALSDTNLKKLLTEYDQEQIAKMFDVNISFISVELTKRDLFKPDINRSRFDLSTGKYEFDVNEDEILGHGMWQELKDTELYKRLMKKNNDLDRLSNLF